MKTFKIQPDEEYIELNNLLKSMNWVSSGGEAKIVIKEGNVKVNNEVELQVRKKLRKGDKVQFESNTIQIAQ